MIDGTLGLLLYLWVVAGFTVLVVSLIIQVLQKRLLADIQRFSLSARFFLLWSVALLPYVCAFYIVALTLLPSLEFLLGLAPDHCHSHGGGQAHSHAHLCWVHPPVFIVLSWQGVSALLFGGFVTFSLTKTFYRAWRHKQYAKTFTGLAEANKNFLLLDSDIPSAFTLGLLRPRVLLSRALLNHLDETQLAIVVGHETAHQKKRDPLRLWLFASVLDVFLPRVAKRFYHVMELTLEQIADATVAADVKNPWILAETLIHVHRLTARFFANPAQFSHCHFTGAPLEQRIDQLLNGSNQRNFPWWNMLLVLGCGLLIGLGGADGTHHLIENLLHFQLIYLTPGNFL